MHFKYLSGLNTLRFFAAFFVIISHGNISLNKLGISKPTSLVFFNRGEDAVNFFFTLSGFLITYLLIVEINKTGTISIRQFYLRRIYRIWPLYFLVVLIGFIILGFIYPKIYHHPYFTFSIPEGLAMFILFVPNYAAKNFTVGLLNPLWSIGVEEQFYLFWAPLLKVFKNKLALMIFFFVVLSTLFYILVYSNLFSFQPNWRNFFLTQKFFAMAIGSIFAYILYHHYDRYNRSFFVNPYTQLLVLLVVAVHYLVGFPFSHTLVFNIISSFLYGLLILNVSVISNKLINLEQPFLTYLGVISYGLYMYHMIIDYVLRITYPKLISLNIRNYILIPLYHILLLSGTMVIAGLSYKYFERFFLRLKDNLHNRA